MSRLVLVPRDKRIAEGKTGKEALRALQRRISPAVYRRVSVEGDQRREAGELR